MTTLAIVSLAALFLLAAMLYSSVGHAGASGYIAVMALFGLTPADGGEILIRGESRTIRSSAALG